MSYDESYVIRLYDSDGDQMKYEHTSYNGDLEFGKDTLIWDLVKVTLPAGLYYLEVSSYYTGNYCFAISGGTTLTSKNVTLHSAVVTYTGKVRNPTVIVKDNYGKRLVKGKDYTVYVPSGRRNVGTYTHKVVFKVGVCVLNGFEISLSYL